MGDVVVSGGEDMRTVKLEKNVEHEGSGSGGGGCGGGSAEVVSWESYLPKMVLRVLLVESDDSTRQIISALLRKCDYRVVAVGDGLKAWEVIKLKHHKIDLILTEAELPSISGFALLTLVMEHDMCKNIPVIMMSSQDSITTVLKCMLKGAADYLIKPVRRNELRNLWQHVWRRQTIGRPVPQNLNIQEQKVESPSENIASKHSNDDAASMRENKECSEKRSEAQSSCTTPYLEAESAYMQNMQGISQLKYGSASNLSNTDMERLEACARADKESVNESESKEKSGTSGSAVVHLNQGRTSTALRLREDHISAMKMVQDEGIKPESCQGDSNNSSEETHICHFELDEPPYGAIDLIGMFDSRPKVSVGHPNSENDGTKHMGCMLQLELSLISCLGNSNKQGSDERSVLNHSDASAFSRYNNSKTLHSLFPTFPSTKLEVTSESHDSREMSTLVSGQTEQTDLSFPGRQIVNAVKSDNICAGYGHSFPSSFATESELTRKWSSKSVCHKTQPPLPLLSSEQGCHLSDKATCDQTVYEQNKLERGEDARPGSPATGQSGCSSLGNNTGDHTGSNAYGSICSRNDGNATLAVAGEMAAASESLNNNGRYASEGLGGVGRLPSSQREAALNKFRLKRKDRCFEKKVRYQSRKLLAEQRPRVKGQFVHRAQTDSPTAAAVDS